MASGTNIFKRRMILLAEIGLVVVILAVEILTWLPGIIGPHSWPTNPH